MTDETLEMLKEIERRNCEDVKDMDEILDVETTQGKLSNVGTALKLEHEERKLRLEESKHKLEVEKFRYQQEQDAKNAANQRDRTIIENIAPALDTAAKVVYDLFVVPRIFNWGMGYEQTNSISSKTFRGFYSEVLRPKLR